MYLDESVSCMYFLLLHIYRELNKLFINIFMGSFGMVEFGIEIRNETWF